MSIAANIFITDTALTPNPLSGVVVNVYDSSTFALIASATSDVNGRAAFSLPGAVSPGTLYEVRLFKLGVIFANPAAIQVIEPLISGTNNFTVTGTVLSLSVATDPRLCRCTGRFMNFANQPIANAIFRVIAKGDYGMQVPKVVDGNLITTEQMTYHTDANGFLTLDLFRTGEFYVMFAGEEETVWNIKVPDRSSVNLIDLIHPQPVSISWDAGIAPGNAVSIHVGQLLVIPFTVLFSDYEIITSGLDKWLQFTVSDPLKGNVGFVATPSQIAIRGLVPGVFTVTGSLLDNLLPNRIPPYSLIAPALTVTIVP